MNKNLSSTVWLLKITVATFILFLTISCKKNKIQDVNDKLTHNTTFIESAKTYFNSLTNGEKKIFIKAKNIKKKSNIPMTPIMDMMDILQWQKSTDYLPENSSSRFLIVPLKEDIKPFKNKSFEFFRNVIFQKDNTGKIKMSILEVLSNRNSSLGKNLQAITIAAIEKKYFSRSQVLYSENAAIIFYNQNYWRDTSFQLQNGKLLPARISFRRDLDITH